MKNPEHAGTIKSVSVQDTQRWFAKTKSKILFLTLFLSLINLSFFHYYKKYETYIIKGDSWGYYTHLVSTFIYDDAGDYHATADATRQQYPGFVDPYIDKYGVRQSPSGHYIIKYTNGVAILLSPFFLAAHAYCKVSGQYSANGFTLPYMLAIGWGVICWAGLAYYFLIRLLLGYFSKWVVVHTVIAIVLGTNLFYNTCYNSIMSHALLFSLYCFLIYYTDSYYRNYKLSTLVLLAFSAAIIILVRPNEIYCLIIPLFYNITNLRTFKERFRHIKTKYADHLIAALCAMLIFVPQIVYWKKYTGSFVYDAYVGEHFDFSKPHIYEGFFSYANGWLVWSPLMIFSLIGIAFLFRYAKHIVLPLVLIFIVHVYFIYSWWCYTYINGFGSRPMEHLYPVLSFSLASFVAVMSKKNLTKVLCTCLVGGGIALNLFQTWQQSKELIVTESANKGFYWEMFGQTKYTGKAIVAYACEEIQRSDLRKIKMLFFSNFNDTANAANVWLPDFKRTMHCLKNRIDTITSFKTDSIGDAKYLVIKFKNMYRSSNSYPYQWDCPLIIFRHLDKNGKTLYDSNMRPHILTGNPTYTFWTNGTPDLCDSIEYNIAIHKRSKTRSIVVCTWNPTIQPFYIDDLEINSAR